MADQKGTQFMTMRTEHGEGVQLIKYENDVIMIPRLLGDPVEKMKAIADLKYKPGDVILCTYPKCGTHWVAQMVMKLEEVPIDPSKPPIFLLDVDVENIESLAEPRVIPTHLWSKRLPVDHVKNNGKVILVLRNPKDVCVSMYHHFKKASIMSNKQTWEEFFTSFIEGSVPFGSYFDYLDAWNKELSGPARRLNVAVFYYEDFLHDATKLLAKLADFLGIERSVDALRRITEECSLANLKEASRKGTEHRGLVDNDGISVIYRKGTVGDWKNYFTVAQNEQFDRIIEESQACKEFKFKY